MRRGRTSIYLVRYTVPPIMEFFSSFCQLIECKCYVSDFREVNLCQHCSPPCIAHELCQAFWRVLSRREFFCPTPAVADILVSLQDPGPYQVSVPSATGKKLFFHPSLKSSNAMPGPWGRWGFYFSLSSFQLLTDM